MYVHLCLTLKVDNGWKQSTIIFHPTSFAMVANAPFDWGWTSLSPKRDALSLSVSLSQTQTLSLSLLELKLWFCGWCQCMYLSSIYLSIVIRESFRECCCSWFSSHACRVCLSLMLTLIYIYSKVASLSLSFFVYHICVKKEMKWLAQLCTCVPVLATGIYVNRVWHLPSSPN